MDENRAIASPIRRHSFPWGELGHQMSGARGLSNPNFLSCLRADATIGCNPVVPSGRTGLFFSRESIHNAAVESAARDLRRGRRA